MSPLPRALDQGQIDIGRSVMVATTRPGIRSRPCARPGFEAAPPRPRPARPAAGRARRPHRLGPWPPTSSAFLPPGRSAAPTAPGRPTTAATEQAARAALLPGRPKGSASAAGNQHQAWPSHRNRPLGAGSRLRATAKPHTVPPTAPAPSSNTLAQAGHAPAASQPIAQCSTAVTLSAWRHATAARSARPGASAKFTGGAARMGEAAGDHTRRRTSVPLVPPKPKLFFTATSIFISRAVLAQ